MRAPSRRGLVVAPIAPAPTALPTGTVGALVGGAPGPWPR